MSKEPLNPYDTYDGEIPFWDAKAAAAEADEGDEEDELEEYEIETDESYILELEERVTHLAEKVINLEKENRALRKMLHDTDAIRQYFRG